MEDYETRFWIAQLVAETKNTAANIIVIIVASAVILPCYKAFTKSCILANTKAQLLLVRVVFISWAGRQSVSVGSEIF